MVFFWLGAAEAESFDINHSFLYLFMVIIGGLGSITGSYMGAIFVWSFPIVMKLLGKEIFDINPTVSGKPAKLSAQIIKAKKVIGTCLPRPVIVFTSIRFKV